MPHRAALRAKPVQAHSAQAALRPAPAGLLHSLTADGVSTQLSLWFSWYNSSDGLEATENQGQASGAYIFRYG